jgi:outer membrane protein OmpA-like peptidoglycan-associated protein
MIGESRQFEEDQIFSKEPVTVIEKEYQNKVTDDFSFELRKNFNYGFNETKLNEEAKAYLDDLAVLLNANKALQLKVSGHTDNIGTVEANQTISEERAKAVVVYLMEIGIEEDRLSYEGKGATVPLYKNNTEENRAKNRRVEFLIYAEKE